MRIFYSAMGLKVFKEYIDRFPDERLNILLAFSDIKPEHGELLTTYRPYIDQLMLDSGAFALNNPRRKQKIQNMGVKDYLYFLERRAHLFDYFFNFDEDFTPSGFKTNYANQLLLENKGYRSVPVIHDYLNHEVSHYIKRRDPVISLGFSKLKNKNNICALSKRIYAAGLKVHALGRSSFPILADAPISFCDSTSWTCRYGQVYFINKALSGQDQKDNIYFEDFKERKARANYYWSYPYRNEFNRFIGNTFNMSWVDLMGKRKYINRSLINIYYFQRLQELITNIHRTKGWNT